MANENISNDSGPIQPPEWNLSELARQHGKHRKTIKRWIDNGWRPDQHGDIKPEPEIMPPARDQQDDARPAHQAIIKAEPEMLPPAPPAQEDARHAHQDVIRAEPEIILPGAPLAHLDAQSSAHRRPWHRRAGHRRLRYRDRLYQHPRQCLVRAQPDDRYERRGDILAPVSA